MHSLILARCLGGLLALALIAAAAPAANAQGPSGCGSVSTTFSASPATGSVSDDEPQACYSIDGAADSNVIAVRLSVTAGDIPLSWRVVDGDGNEICSQYYAAESDGCVLRGAAGWSLVVTTRWEAEWSGSTSFLLTARRMDTTNGCTELATPDVWSFTAPRISGSISGALGVRCYAFERAESAPDEAFWIRTDRTSGTIAPRWRLVGPTGGVECASAGLAPYRCELRASGRYALLVDGASPHTGSYFLAASRVNLRDGCQTGVSTGFGAAPVEGDVSQVGEVDCFELSDVASDDLLRITVDRPEVRWAVIDADGHFHCSNSWGDQKDCRVAGRSGWALLVYNDLGASAFAYRVSARRLTGPEGCADLGSTDTWSFTRPRSNGSVGNAVRPQCFTFERAVGDPDDAVWLRTVRTSGAFSPGWHVYDPRGERVCSGAQDRYAACNLRAFGVHTVVVEDRSLAAGGDFFLTAVRGSDPSGCGAAPPATFGSAPTVASIATAGEVDCHSLAGLENGDLIDVTVTAGYWDVVDGGGQVVCSGYSNRAECALSGTDGWSLLVYGDGTSPAFGYRVSARRLNDPEGCAELGAPDVWSFTSPRLSALIAGAAEPRCYTFERENGEADGVYLFRALRSSGALLPVWRVYDANGWLTCTSQSAARCRLQSPGTQTIVVDDHYGANPGGFVLAADRITDPAGCAQIRSVTNGVPRTSGKLAGVGEVDCYSLPASDGDQLSFATSSGPQLLSVYRENGDLLCGPSWGSLNCTASGDGQVLALVEDDDGASSGSYWIEATCDNPPCGVTDTAVVDVTPSTVGSGGQASVLVRGRDLQALESVRFTRSGTALEGELEAAAADGRTRRIRIDTTSAPSGAYQLEATFADGSTRTVANALTVTSTRPAEVRLDLVGRPVFRPGQASTVVVQATNSGNVDARGVSMILGGLPAGSTLAPQGGITEVSGSAENPRFETVDFDQERGTILTDQGLIAPFFIPRVPAGSSVQIAFDITAAASYQLRVLGGECFGQVPDAGARLSRSMNSATAGEECGHSLLGLALNWVPGSNCATAAYDAIQDTVWNARTEKPFTWGNALNWGMGRAVNILDCATEFTPLTIYKSAAETASRVYSGANVAYECARFAKEFVLEQQAVAAIDPNDIIGPAGAGEGRYITGEGDQLYDVLFENLPSATAPAQRVVVTNQLDTAKFDPSTLRFRSVAFGGTVVPLATPVSEVDEMIDLRPHNELLVHVTASASSAGLVRWELQAIDPETLAPPTDPLAGFLPPNDATHRGEGNASYTVRLKTLPEGSEVTNRASIVFDANEAIDTPTWKNIIDRSPPTVGVQAQSAAVPNVANVSWSGSDSASGVARWDITVSKDGGEPVLWRTARAAGNAKFVAEQAGVYTFRATAHDGATNSTQSTQAAVSLTLPSGKDPDTGGDDGKGGTDRPDPPNEILDVFPATPDPLEPIGKLLGVSPSALKRLPLPRNAGWMYVATKSPRIKRLAASTKLPVVIALDRRVALGFAMTARPKGGGAKRSATSKPATAAAGARRLRLAVPKRVRSALKRGGVLMLRPVIGGRKGGSLKIRVG